MNENNNDQNDDPSPKSINFRQFHKEFVAKKTKEAYERMLDSYKYFAEDRLTWSRFGRELEQIDLALAEIDGRLKKVKPKYGPGERRSKPSKTPEQIQNEIVDHFSSLDKDGKDEFLKKLKGE